MGELEFHYCISVYAASTSSLCRESYVLLSLIFRSFYHCYIFDIIIFRTESVIHTSLVQLKGCGCTQNLAINRTSDSNKIANVNDLACSIRPCSTDEKRIM